MLSEAEMKIRTYLVILAFILFSIFIIGTFWISTMPTETVTYALSYAAGLSMIFLPCTLPLAFIIVPLSMGNGYRKGFLMALLFGLGLIVTITLYAIVIGTLGQVLGLDRATQFMWLIAGSAALLFGLSEVKLIKLRIPGYGGAAPQFIQKQGDYLKAFFMGLFLGNAGVGCPNPAFYVLLTYIASVGNVGTSLGLGFIHGLGRATPLIFLSILGILGVNAVQSISARRIQFERIIGWSLIIIGAFILINGLPSGHQWYEENVVHVGWNDWIASTGLVAEIPEEEHGHEDTFFLMPYYTYILIILILIPVIVNYYKSKKTPSSAKRKKSGGM